MNSLCKGPVTGGGIDRLGGEEEWGENRLQIGRGLEGSHKDLGFYPKGYREPVKRLSKEQRIEWWQDQISILEERL